MQDDQCAIFTKNGGVKLRISTVFFGETLQFSFLISQYAQKCLEKINEMTIIHY